MLIRYMSCARSTYIIPETNELINDDGKMAFENFLHVDSLHYIHILSECIGSKS